MLAPIEASDARSVCWPPPLSADDSCGGVLRAPRLPASPQNAPAGIGGALSMANAPLTPRELVDRLDSRHDELIAKLDELNAQIEAALAEFGRARETKAASSESKRLCQAA